MGSSATAATVVRAAGSSATLIRAVVTTSATPTEASSAAVARDVVSSSVTPTARGFLEAVMKKLQSLAPLGACSDLRFSPVSAWFERDGAGYDTSGSEVAIRPRALSHQLASLPRDLPFLLAARADEDGDDYKSGSEGSGDDSAVATRTVVTSTRSPSMVGNHPRALNFIPSRPIRLYSAMAWTPWEQKRPTETPPSPLNVCLSTAPHVASSARAALVPLASRPFTSAVATPMPPSELSPRDVCLSTGPHFASSARAALVPLGSRLFTSATATSKPPPPPSELCPRNVLYLIDLLDGMVLSTNEELMFRKAFNEKFPSFKVADILNHLESEDFTIEEWCFMLKIIHSKLGPNKELAELLLQQDINLSSTNDEIMRNPVLARVETKVDILRKMVDEGNSEILKCVRVSNKGEWGTIEVFGKKLDLTKLEFVRKLIEIIMGA